MTSFSKSSNNHNAATATRSAEVPGATSGTNDTDRTTTSSAVHDQSLKGHLTATAKRVEGDKKDSDGSAVGIVNNDVVTYLGSQERSWPTTNAKRVVTRVVADDERQLQLQESQEPAGGEAVREAAESGPKHKAPGQKKGLSSGHRPMTRGNNAGTLPGEADDEPKDDEKPFHGNGDEGQSPTIAAYTGRQVSLLCAKSC